MDGKTSVKYIQSYIKRKDYKPELKKDYFLKLSEEVGELATAIANCYDIDVESVIKIKEEINNKKYNTGIVFEENR